MMPKDYMKTESGADKWITRIMVYKGMVYKSKYWIFEKNKGMPVSNSQHL